MPCDDKVVNARGYDLLLAMEFGEPIDARRGSCLGLLTWCVVGVGTKDVVSADMDEQTTHLLHRAGKVSGAMALSVSTMSPAVSALSTLVQAAQLMMQPIFSSATT